MRNRFLNKKKQEISKTQPQGLILNIGSNEIQQCWHYFKVAGIDIYLNAKTQREKFANVISFHLTPCFLSWKIWYLFWYSVFLEQKSIKIEKVPTLPDS